ncbi:MAG: DNA-3-methyladenine glycosylase family protein [Candidatus Rokuibacteriota bacterium]
MRIVLTVDGPLDISKTLARYRLWGEDPANRLVGDTFLRVRRAADRLWPYTVRGVGPVDAAALVVEIPGARSVRVSDGVAAEVRRIFGLDFDLSEFYRMAKSDPTLAALIEPLYGLRPTVTPCPLEMLVGAISAQQVNLAFAFALRARLVRRYGEAVCLDGETVHAFPSAAALAGSRISTLRAMQFSTRKAEYIRELARAVVSGALDLGGMLDAPSARVIELITAQRGLGRWTADWFLARGLGRGDVCPAGDLAVRKAFARSHPRGRSLSERAIRRRASAWGPHQTVAVHYLLAGLRLGRPEAGGGT